MVTYDARPSGFTQLTLASEWEYIWSCSGGVSAIDGSAGSAMTPSLDVGGRNAVIADGMAVLRGQLWRCDAPVSTPIPAASAQNRIDRLVLRLNRGATSSPTVVQPFIITGTPSGSPVLPPIVQTSTGIWDFPVFHWTSTSAGGLTTLVDDRRLTNDQWHDMRPLTGGWFGTISGYAPPQYRFSDDLNWVEISGHVQSPVASGNYNSVVFFTFPSAYRVITPTHQYFASGAADGAATPIVHVQNSGNLFFNFLPTAMAQTIIGIEGRFPIEDQNGYLQS